MKTMQSVQVGDAVCGPGRPLLWILGPCAIESHDLTLRIADTLAELAAPAEHPGSVQGFVRQGQPHLRQVVPRAGAARGH